MYKKSVDCTVLQNIKIKENLYDMRVESSYIAQNAKVGQFLHIKCEGVYLRRPISICDVYGDTVRFVYEVKGEGLLNLSKVLPNDKINILGPLGNSFLYEGDFKNPLIIGGGIGVFPLLYLAKKLKVNAVLGFRNKDTVCLLEDFEEICASTVVVTDDGSYGEKGNVCDVLLSQIDKGNIPDVIFACGPRPMLAALSKIVVKHNIKTQISLEERMACGIGACLGCASKTKNDNGNYEYLHVCKDGPIFDAEKVVF